MGIILVGFYIKTEMNCMKDNIIFDTDILVYAFDKSEKEKNAKAKSLVLCVENNSINGVITNQILGELFNVLTAKVQYGISYQDASSVINDFIFSDKWHKINYTYNTVSKTLEMCRELNKPFWDTLIIMTAIENNINKIYTENLKDFSAIGGIKIINPFDRI
jgi:predicted nucleic acid-binding protein